MITEAQMYWLTRLDEIKTAVVGIGVISILICAVALTFSCIIRFDDKDKRATKFVISSAIGLLFSALLLSLHIFVPTTKQMCAIKIIPMITNDEQVQEIPNKLVELADEWIEELKPNNTIPKAISGIE